MSDTCTPLKLLARDYESGRTIESEQAQPHCGHRTGVVLTSMPPVARVVCCYCGAQGSIKSAPIKGHGAYAPPEYFDTGVEWDR